MRQKYVDSKTATTPNEIRLERIERSRQWHEKYVFSPLRFVGLIFFLLLLYVFIFKV